uniref:Metallo-beta-lactamase domain-containing protein n=1 Tax=Graphocephala atropunctata TaxID=36148 RepID=A0A1B6MPN7_9HEMI
MDTPIISATITCSSTPNNTLWGSASTVETTTVCIRSSLGCISGEVYKIDEDVSVLPTPGHTSEDVTVLVKTRDYGTVAVTGDLFEREEDLSEPSLWREVAGSQFPDKQETNRNKILAVADYIVPGHGPMFKVSQEIKNRLKPD